MKTRKSALEIIQSIEKSGAGKLLLLPLSLVSYIFYIIVSIRAFLYKLGLLETDELACRVICVGNITSGGTGKTPTVQLLASKMQQQGIKVAILSRGYMGNLGGRLEVVAAEQQILRSAAEVGDEPYLLANKLPGIPVVVGKKRWRAGMYVYSRFAPQAIILDDGYQHLQLARQSNIMVIDATNPFGNHYLLPRGTLREPLPALSRAQIFLLTKTDLAENISPLMAILKTYNPAVPIITSIHQPVNVTELGKKKVHSLKWLNGKKVVCFCGIADPASFVKTVQKLGAEIAGQLSFPDHYAYTADDLKELADEAQKLGAEALITTEKDAVRIGESTPPGMPILTLNIELKITNEEEWGKAWGIIIGENS